LLREVTIFGGPASSKSVQSFEKADVRWSPEGKRGEYEMAKKRRNGFVATHGFRTHPIKILKIKRVRDESNVDNGRGSD